MLLLLRVYVRDLFIYNAVCRLTDSWNKMFQFIIILVLYMLIHCSGTHSCMLHDEVMTWKRFRHYWPFVLGIHQSLVDSLHKGPVMWCSFLMFWTSCWTSSSVAGNLRCHIFVTRQLVIVSLLEVLCLIELALWQYWLCNHEGYGCICTLNSLRAELTI